MPLLVLLFMGIMYVLMLRINQSAAGFILLAIASGIMLYWVRELKRMAGSEEPRSMPREADQKEWGYDLIKNNGEMVFIAEVPGPEDQIDIRLASGILHIKGGQNFVRDVRLELSKAMGISDYKYRNGVLTIKIHEV